MVAADSITPEHRQFSIRMPRPLWIGVVIAMFPLPAAFAEDASDEISEKNAPLLERQVRITAEVAKARHRYAGAIKLLDPVTADTYLRQKIAIVDQLCALTDAQEQKLKLVGRGDIKRLSGRVEEIGTQFRLVENDAVKIDELHEQALQLRRGLVVLSNDESLFVKVLEKLLTAEQTAKYQPLRDVFRVGGLAVMNDRGSGEGLAIILNGTAFADGGFVQLNDLPNLRSLSLTGTQVTDAGLSHLKGLTSLELLDLGDTQVTDAGLVHMEGLTKLETLGLENTHVTDGGLVHLTGLTGLRDLNLVKTRVTDAGLVHLTGLTNLERLRLDGTRVTDGGMVHLQRLNKLRQIVLDNTRVTNAGLEYLKGLTNLVELVLTRTQVTDAGVAELKQVLPGLRIYR